MTYHGYYVNVDWYLKASLNTQEFLSPATHAEEDFLLLDQNTPIDPLPALAPEEAPNKSKIEAFFRFLLEIGWVLLIMLLVTNFNCQHNDAIPWIVMPLALIIAWIARRKIINFVLERIIEVKEAQVKPLTIQPGDEVSCRLQFQANTSIYLDHITTVIRAKECSTRDREQGNNGKSTPFILSKPSNRTAKSLRQGDGSPLIAPFPFPPMHPDL